MNRKFYIQPHVRTMEVRPAQILAVSVIDDVTADPDEEILVKENGEDVFQDEFFDFEW